MKNKIHSLLDTHQYSKDALKHFYRQLFETYSDEEKVLKVIFSFFRQILREKEDVKRIIEGMDKIDGIRAQKSKLKIEKNSRNMAQKSIFSAFVP